MMTIENNEALEEFLGQLKDIINREFSNVAFHLPEISKRMRHAVDIKKCPFCKHEGRVHLGEYSYVECTICQARGGTVREESTQVVDDLDEYCDIIADFVRFDDGALKYHPKLRIVQYCIAGWWAIKFWNGRADGNDGKTEGERNGKS